MELTAPHARRPSNSFPSHSPKPGARLTALLGCALSRSLAWRLHSQKGSVQYGPHINADYNIGCKCTQIWDRFIGPSGHFDFRFWIFDWENPKSVISLVTRRSPLATCYCFRDRIIDILLMQKKSSPVLASHCGYPANTQD